VVDWATQVRVARWPAAANSARSLTLVMGLVPPAVRSPTRYGVAGLGLKGLSSDTAHDSLARAVFDAPRSVYLYVAVGMSAVGMAREVQW
jgi:hypothetical protein